MTQPQQHQPVPQQQSNPYNNQFINTLPSPVAMQQTGHRASFTQFQNSPQMNQFRLMQQQQQSHHQQHHQQHSTQQKINYGQTPQQQAIRPIPQFFPQMNQQQFSQQAMQIPGQVVGPQGAMPQNPVRQNIPSTDEQNDPLFMLKEM